MGWAVKRTQTGFLVGGNDYEDLQVFGSSGPHAEAGQGLPAGRGFYACPGEPAGQCERGVRS